MQLTGQKLCWGSAFTVVSNILVILRPHAFAQNNQSKVVSFQDLFLIVHYASAGGMLSLLRDAPGALERRAVGGVIRIF